MRIVAIVQARMGSTRLPNKVMKPIGDKSMIEVLLLRLSKSRHINQILVATSIEPKNDILEKHIRSLGYDCFRGSENDVLQRYIDAGYSVKADIVVRITGDCPLVDPVLVDDVVEKYLETQSLYSSNILPPTFPDGLDVEVIDFLALKKSAEETHLLFDHEHVTPYIQRNHLIKKSNITNKIDYSALRWTVDDYKDYEVVKNVFNYFSPRIHFSWKEILNLQKKSPKLFMTNQTTKRNEGATLDSGQKLWRRAKGVIPGGNMLLSKRAEMYLPDQWPAYFRKAKGCTVWDLDGNSYIDMSLMGVGTNILGYGHPEVDQAVHAAVLLGNMSTFNCPEEVYLAEKIVEIHPWADMVRFARSGGEANAIAIRIARAASGREKVAVCGYHGWHDWYLAANLGNDECLAGHLLPGLDPKGVPSNLKGTVFPFNYNDYEELEKLVSEHEIGVIKMEVVRNRGPENNFLQKVRKLATDKNIILVFDECTSGFRQTFGGIHKLFGVEPDMAIFGKALGNGYAITATIGRREIMEASQSTFISSTFWTERIGPSAALKTLEVMEQIKSWEIITKAGINIRDKWQKLADMYQLKINHWGLASLTGFTFCSKNHLAYKTLITQEMLTKGYLAGNSVYTSIEHTDQVVDKYFENLDPVFKLIKECEDGRDINLILKGPICHAGFRRLN